MTVAASANGGEEDGWAAVVAGGDAAPVLEAAEHDLDAVTAFVPALVVFDGQRAGFAARNAGLDALLLQRIPEPVGVIAAVGQQPLRLGQVVEQGRRTGVIADLAGGHEEAQGAAVGIGDGVKLGVHAALGPADQAPEIPFFTPGWKPCGGP
jgi:hypothetical protein